MGYYADFSFSIVIPAKHVPAAERALVKSLKASGEWDFLDKPKVIEGCFCNVFDAVWSAEWSPEGILSEEAGVAPLKALAGGSMRGSISITGCVNKRWREWEEPLLDELAPFFEDGSTVTVKGEDSDTPDIWIFEGGVRNVEAMRLIRDSEEKTLRAKAERLETAEQLLRELREWNSWMVWPPIWGRLDEFFREKTALEQLAEQADE